MDSEELAMPLPCVALNDVDNDATKIEVVMQLTYWGFARDVFFNYGHSGLMVNALQVSL